MSQTSKLAGGILVGFLVYVTARGQLKSYLSLFGVGAASTSVAPSEG